MSSVQISPKSLIFAPMNPATFNTMNRLGKAKQPFLFLISFDKTDIRIFPLPASSQEVMYQFPNATNVEPQPIKGEFLLKKEPPAFDNYQKKFERSMQYLQRGDISLLNLTQASRIELNRTTEELFHAAKALYKLHLPGLFTLFSPETFIQIKGNSISSFPMKGTIDAATPDAENVILNDPKELDEHQKITDFTMQDLRAVAKDIRVERFRFITRVKNMDKELLQVSSQVSGELPANWHEQLGDILDQLLPSGSICGIPRDKSYEVIQEVEGYNRGFYTGVMGVFDGESVDSAVMIRFVEEQGGQLYYKSGGGVTANSIAQKEYEELIDKIYVPVY